MNLAHKIELDPTVQQRIALSRACGVARFTWNWALAASNKAYEETGKSTKFTDLKKAWNATKRAEFPWVLESPKDANQQPFANLQAAFVRFFKKIARKPKFKKKGKRDSFYVSNDLMDLQDDTVRLPVIGRVRLKETPRFAGKIMSATVSRSADRWFVSVSYELPNRMPEKAPGVADREVIGVDLGIKDLAVLSDGTRIPNPKHFQKASKSLKRAQRGLSRKLKGSSNRRKAKSRLSKLHFKIKCQRQDTTHKLSRLVVGKANTIVLEDLNVSGMSKNHALAGSVLASAFAEIRRQVTYKAENDGKTVILAPRFFPSSKTCSSCGHVYKELSLRERAWACAACGTLHDRDLNAAINLEKIGQAMPEFTPPEKGVPAVRKDSGSLSRKEEPNRAHLCSQLG